jgi:hypothetical protein
MSNRWYSAAALHLAPLAKWQSYIFLPPRERKSEFYRRPIPRDGAYAPPRDEVINFGAIIDPHGEEARSLRGVSNHEALARERGSLAEATR